MKIIFAAAIFVLIFCSLSVNTTAQKSGAKLKFKNYQPILLEKTDALNSLVNRAAQATLEKFSSKNLKPEQLAITLIDMRDATHLKGANYNGETKLYPASVIKMFYLAATMNWLEEGKLKDSPELRRALRDMIVDSSNDATGFVVDVLTGTGGGTELTENELRKYGERREVVNRFYTALNYQNINVNQKTYCEDLYGRERQFWNAGKNRNMLTTNATARLLAEIVFGKIANAEHTKQMLDLLKRDYSGVAKDPDDQAHGFTGIALQNIKGARLWSKAGWTSTARHDAAYVETPDGLKFVLVVYTQNQANEREIIPHVARIILDGLGEVK